MSIKLNIKEQSDILNFITETLNLYESQSEDYRDQNLQIYEALSTFTEPNTGENLPRFKINLMHIFLRQVVPRIIANAPKPIVSVRTDAFFEGEEDLEGEERAMVMERNSRFAQAMQDYLTTVFNKNNMKESLKYWAVNQLTYGNAYAEVISKYKVKRSKVKTKEGQKITSKMVDVTPVLDIISWSEMFLDPRFKMMEEMPGYFRVKQGVRLRDLELATDEDGKPKYFNIEELKKLGNTKWASSSDYKDQILSITGIDNVNTKSGIDKNSLDLEVFYGYYSLTGEAKDERIYEFTTVNRAIIIGAVELTELPILDIKGHEDPEIFYAVGLLAPILGVQDEINYQKNSRATAVSKSLNRDYFWAADSGVDPSQLVGGKGGNIIYAANGVAQAEAGLKEIADRPLDNTYFSDINDLNRDAQRLTHTTDVTQPQGQTSLTNTATGARISFFESNSVIAELRKNFEKGVEELGYKILDWTFNNIDKDITLKNKGGKFFKLKKEAFRDALERYEIKIEANSSSFDDLESRRDDAIAIKNITLEAIKAGIPVDAIEAFKNVYGTFENINPEEMIKEQEVGIEELTGLAGGKQVPEERPGDAAALTEAVATGGLTEGL